MTTSLHSFIAPPPTGWKCMICKKSDDAFDLLTHKDAKAQCIFHRMCYLGSLSARTGMCQKCGTVLHEGRIYYIASDTDDYETRDLARFLRTSESAECGRCPFDEADFNRIIRSSSWDGIHSEPSGSDKMCVRNAVWPLLEKQGVSNGKTSYVRLKKIIQASRREKMD